jgi:hypothetical protein
MPEKPTYEEVLSPLTTDQKIELLNRKVDCVMQGLEYFFNQWRDHENPNMVEPQLQIPWYPQANVIIGWVPDASGHPRFYADDPAYDAEAQHWNKWPTVPPHTQG